MKIVIDKRKLNDNEKCSLKVFNVQLFTVMILYFNQHSRTWTTKDAANSNELKIINEKNYNSHSHNLNVKHKIDPDDTLRFIAEDFIHNFTKCFSQSIIPRTAEVSTEILIKFCHVFHKRLRRSATCDSRDPNSDFFIHDLDLISIM